MSKFVLPRDKVDRVKMWQEQKILVEQALKNVRISQIELSSRKIQLAIKFIDANDNDNNILSEQSALKKEELNLRMEELALCEQKERLEEAIINDIRI